MMTSENVSISNLNLRQTMLGFAYLAYTGEGLTDPDPGPSILRNINAALPKVRTGQGSLAGWSVVWGPVPYTIPGALYQENMVYVVRNGTTSQYAIAIRGTNFTSQVDWFLEDFEVINTMPWPIPGAVSKCGPGAVISESSSIDLHILIGSPMTDPRGGQLLEFLRTTTSRGPINLCVTGHSLGGQLANLLGLYLLENPIQWDSTRRSTVSCISFAAPTAGNDVFAKNANKVYAAGFAAGTFPGWDRNLGSNLDNVGCSLDGAPLVYASENFYYKKAAGPLFEMYAAPSTPTDNINFKNLHLIAWEEWSYFQSMVLRRLAVGLSPQNYTQLVSQRFAGQFIGSGLVLSQSLIGYIEAFAAQAGWQHSCSYPIYLGMPMLFDPRIVVRSADPVPAKPVITQISPNHASKDWPTGHSVKITGSGFAASTSANFLVFSDPANRITYEISSATETEIQATFYVRGLDKGTQTVSVVTSTPYFTSNAVPFKIT